MTTTPEVDFSEQVIHDVPGAMDSDGLQVPKVDFGEGDGRRLRFEPDVSKDPMVESPTAYATMRTVLDFVPYARYILPSERQKLWHLSEGEMRMQLAGDLFWAELALAFAPSKALGGKTPMGALARLPFKSLKWSPKEKPLEDLVNLKLWKPIDDTAELERVARKKLKFSKLEAPAVAQAVLGDSSVLWRTFGDLHVAGKPMSEAWSKFTKFIPGKGLALSEDVLPRLDLNLVRSKALIREFRKALSTVGLRGEQTKGGYRPLDPMWAKAAYRDLAKPYFAEDVAATLDLNVASEQLIANLVSELLGSSKARAVARQIVTLRGATGGVWPAALTASPTVMGFGESRFGTYKLFRRIVGAFENKWNYAADKFHLFNEMLAQRGLGTMVIKKRLPTGEVIYSLKPSKFFTPEVAEEGNRLLNQFDNIAEVARKVPKKELAGALTKARAEIAGQLAEVKTKNPALGDFLETYYSLMDHVYGDWVKWEIPRALRAVGLTPHGATRVATLMSRLNPIIDKTFATSTSGSYVETLGRLKQILGVAQKVTLRGIDTETITHPWFQGEGQDLAKKLARLFEDLSLPSMDKKGRFVDYLENYSTRLYDRGYAPIAEKFDALIKGRKSFWTRQRTLEESRQLLSFEDRLAARINAQAAAMHLHPVLDEVADYAKRLPPAWQTYIEHLVRRSLGMPSDLDTRVAEVLARSVGRVERAFGSEGAWDAQRVNNLAYTVNDLVYMGALGFKPFSALRNLLQFPLTVPADLGGIKDLVTCALGVRRGLSKDGATYLQGIGAITEYLPEIRGRIPILPFGKKFLGVVPIRQDRVRDVSLWMFQASDRWTRYMSGGAAMVKWEKAIAKLGTPTPASIKGFERTAGITNRNSWIRAEIRDHLLAGRLDEAKKTFVLDVVGDTMFLYGAIYRPGLLSELGAVGRTASIFQTWWMHYGTLLDKWLRTGASPGAKLERYFTWMLSSALVYEAAERLWGGASARRTVGFGPFPRGLQDIGTPPAWGVAELGLKNILQAGDIAFGQDPQKATPAVIKLLKASIIFVPGGLAAVDLGRGASREGLAGFLKALGRFKAPEENRGPISRGVGLVEKVLE